MKNIQLETLLEVLSQIETKRMFLYVDNPSKEPEYITIGKFFEFVDTKFGLTDIIKQIKDVLNKFEIYDLHFESLDTDVNNIKEIIAGLNVDNKQLKEDVAYLLKTMTKVLGDLSLHASKIETNKNNIITLQDNVSVLQQNVQQLQEDLTTGNTGNDEKFAAMAWRKL